jgi:hypothetical protein
MHPTLRQPSYPPATPDIDLVFSDLGPIVTANVKTVHAVVQPTSGSPASVLPASTVDSAYDMNLSRSTRTPSLSSGSDESDSTDSSPVTDAEPDAENMEIDLADGVGATEAHEANLTNIRELRDIVIRVRTNFKSIAPLLENFDQKGFVSTKFILGQAVRGKPLMMAPQWMSMWNVSHCVHPWLDKH